MNGGCFLLFVQVGMKEFVDLFTYDPDVLASFPFLHHFMNDREIARENYFAGPKTNNRICSHTEVVFQMLNQIVHEVNVNQTTI